MKNYTHIIAGIGFIITGLFLPTSVAHGALSANVLLYYNGTNFTATGTPQLTAGNYLATTTATSTFNGPILGPIVDKAGQVANVKAYGATGNGVTDDTTAVTNAIAAGGMTFFPAGTYLVSGLTLKSGTHLLGVGYGNYGNAASTTQRSIIKLKNSSNADVLLIPELKTYGTIENLEIDGNKANNASGKGINFADGVASQESGWTVRNVEVYNTAGVGIYNGDNRQAFFGDHITVTAAGEHGIQSKGSDATWVKPLVGTSGFSNIVASGYVTRFIGGETWSATDQGIVITSPLVSITDMGVDRNGKNGILIDTGASDVSIKGVLFHSNSQTTNNTYSDINVNATGGRFSIVGNAFGPIDAGITNKRKYAIDTNTTNTANVVGNTYDSSASATGFSDSGSNTSLSMESGTFLKSGSNVIYGGNGFNTFMRPDSSNGDIQIQSFAGSTNSIFRDNGYFGLGTTTPRNIFHVSSGANATTTPEEGDPTVTSKVCRNTKNAAGVQISWFFNAANTLTVQAGRCLN